MFHNSHNDKLISERILFNMNKSAFVVQRQANFNLNFDFINLYHR